MADELAKKISELDPLPNNDLRGFNAIGSKDNAQGNPVSYRVDLGFVTEAAQDAEAAAQDAEEAAEAFDAAIVQSTGDNQNKVMSQKATTDALATKQGVISDLSTIRSGASAGATAYQKPGGGIPSSDIANGVIPDVSNFITKSVNDLVNYYQKSETYTKTEVNGLIGAIDQFHYEIYASISAITSPASNVLYLIGPTGSGSDKYEEYVYSGGNFVKIGDTTIDLSGYVTTTALNTALANYTTTTDLTTLLAGKVDKVNGKGLSTNDFTTEEKTKLSSIASGAQVNVIETVKVNGTALTPSSKSVNIDISGKADKDADAVEGNLAKFDGNGNPVDAGYSAMRIHRDLGYNAAQATVVLTAGETGKYVKRSTRSAEANANFNISAPFNVDACSELLIKTGYNPSDNEHAALDISVIAIYEEMERTRTVQAKDGNNNPLYYEVDEDGNPTSTQTTTVTPYPVYTTETYTEHRYLPNNEDRLVAIPDSGYYVANIPQSCKCVISYKPGVTDLNVIVVKHGALANLTSQIFGIYEHRTMAEAVVSLALRLDALERRIVRPGNIEVGKIDAVDIMRYRQPVVLLATGAPNASLRPTNLPDDIPWDGIPAFIGQFYYAEWKDGANTIRRLYFSTNITAISDWHYVALT